LKKLNLDSGPASKSGKWPKKSHNALFYDVYTRLSDLHLADIGVDVDWSDVDVTHTNKDRWGKTREYFTMPIYRLPEGRMRAM